MCLNCGCGEYWDRKEHQTNITMEDVEKAAKGEGMSVQDTAKEMIRGLQDAMKQTPPKKK
jgi:hypothetical protein